MQYPHHGALVLLVRPGEVTLDGFIAFAQKKTWGQEVVVEDPFSAIVAAGTLRGPTENAIGADIPGESAEEVNSDGEDAR